MRRFNVALPLSEVRVFRLHPYNPEKRVTKLTIDSEKDALLYKCVCHRDNSE